MKCAKCENKVISPKTLCESCNEHELKENAPKYFSAYINGKLEYGPYKTDNTLDRWKEKD